MADWLRSVFGEGKAPSPAFYALEDGLRVYAIGDVHGRADLLGELLERIKQDREAATGRTALVMLGDVIDRGPGSREAVEMVAKAEGFGEVVYLRGNHEQALIDFLDDPVNNPEWLGYGADVACASYGVMVRDGRGFGRDVQAICAELAHALDEAGHLEMIRATPLSWSSGEVLFVHAGVRRGVPVADQLPHDLCTIREGFLGQPHGLGCRVVFGHTPMNEPLIEDDRLGLDTGAYRTGVLTCAVLEGPDVCLLQTGRATA